MMTLGTISAIIAGLALPSIALIMGSIASSFGDSGIDPADMSSVIAKTSKWVAAVAATIMVFSYLFYSFWQSLAENISFNLRKMYLKALLNQEVAFFENQKIE